jgi:hypothetical protein
VRRRSAVSAWILTVLIDTEHWYSSGTFWAALGVGVALLIGVPTFLVTWVPRQRLYYWAPPATPLVAASTRGITDLEIRHDGRRLADPYLLAVTLTVRGRRDIPSSAFDQGRPLVFDLGARIVKVLQIRCSPAASLAPPVTVGGSALRVGPELVGRRQITTISVLVDGGCPHLVCTQPVLAQVSLIARDPPDPLPWSRAVMVAWVVVTGPVAARLGFTVLMADMLAVIVVGVPTVEWLRRRPSSS